MFVEKTKKRINIRIKKINDSLLLIYAKKGRMAGLTRRGWDAL